MTEFGKRLTRAMHDHKKSAADVSRMTGISESNISRYLSGSCEPSLKNAVVIADELGITVEWLSGKEEEETEYSKKMTRIFAALSLSDKDKVLEYAELLRSKERK